jgi:hypothetical protein
MIVLKEMGDDAMPLLLRIDPDDLTGEQRARMAELTAGYRRLTAKEAEGLRSDRSFLVDCLEADAPALRSAALVRLREVTGEQVEFDVAADSAARAQAAAALRVRLLGPKGDGTRLQPDRP